MTSRPSPGGLPAEPVPATQGGGVSDTGVDQVQLKFDRRTESVPAKIYLNLAPLVFYGVLRMSRLVVPCLGLSRSYRAVLPVGEGTFYAPVASSPSAGALKGLARGGFYPEQECIGK